MQLSTYSRIRGALFGVVCATERGSDGLTIGYVGLGASRVFWTLDDRDHRLRRTIEMERRVNGQGIRNFVFLMYSARWRTCAVTVTSYRYGLLVH